MQLLAWLKRCAEGRDDGWQNRRKCESRNDEASKWRPLRPCLCDYRMEPEELSSTKVRQGDMGKFESVMHSMKQDGLDQRVPGWKKVIVMQGERNQSSTKPTVQTLFFKGTHRTPTQIMIPTRIIFVKS